MFLKTSEIVKDVDTEERRNFSRHSEGTFQHTEGTWSQRHFLTCEIVYLSFLLQRCFPNIIDLGLMNTLDGEWNLELRNIRGFFLKKKDKTWRIKWLVKEWKKRKTLKMLYFRWSTLYKILTLWEILIFIIFSQIGIFLNRPLG